MLRLEDCKPGVEVISLTDSYYTEPYSYPFGERKKYHIYTIEEVFPEYYFREGIYPAIFLHEIHGIQLCTGIRIPTAIKNFKLIDPKQLDQFKLLLDKPLVYDKTLEVIR